MGGGGDGYTGDVCEEGSGGKQEARGEEGGQVERGEVSQERWRRRERAVGDEY